MHTLHWRSDRWLASLPEPDVRISCQRQQRKQAISHQQNALSAVCLLIIITPVLLTHCCAFTTGMDKNLPNDLLPSTYGFRYALLAHVRYSLLKLSTYNVQQWSFYETIPSHFKYHIDIYHLHCYGNYP